MQDSPPPNLFDAPGEFKRLHVRAKPGRTLICGSRVYAGRADRRSLYGECVGVDMLPGPGVDLVADLEVPHPALGKFDHIECCSVLEHSQRPWKLAENLEDMMLPGGTLHLSAPFIWRPHAYPNDYWRFTIEALPLLFQRIYWKVRMYGNLSLHAEGKLPGVKVASFPYFARTEVYGFGMMA